MAESSTPLPLHAILEGVSLSHKRDIQLMTSGYLNHNRLWKPEHQETAQHWSSSKKDIPVLSVLGSSSNLPPTPRQSLENVPDALCNPSASSIDQGPKYVRNNSAVSVISDVAGELPLPSPPPRTKHAFPYRTGSPKSLAPLGVKKSGTRSPHRAVYFDSHLGGVTKKEQYKLLMDFENNVIKRPEMYEKNVLLGGKIIDHLEKRLKQMLSYLSEEHLTKTPNLRRLEVYSEIWDEFIDMDPVFGDLLAIIKAEYEQYMDSLLETQPHKGSQVLRLACNTPIPPGTVSNAQQEVKRLEEEVNDLSAENSRLRIKTQELRDDRANRPYIRLPPPVPQATPSSRYHSPHGIEAQIVDMHVGILAKMETVRALERELREDNVPVSVCVNLDQCGRDMEADVLKISSTNEYLEKTVRTLESDLDKMLLRCNTTSDEAREIRRSISLLVVNPHRPAPTSQEQANITGMFFDRSAAK